MDDTGQQRTEGSGETGGDTGRRRVAAMLSRVCPRGVAGRPVTMTTSFYPDRPEAKWHEAVLFSRQPEVALTGNPRAVAAGIDRRNNRAKGREETYTREEWRGEEREGRGGSMVDWQKMRKKDAIPC